MLNVHYLSVQDVLWINLQVTKKVNHYRFAMLEEATFCQYAIGSQPSVDTQASRLLNGLIKLRPFDLGNEATALVGCEAFLNLNGRELGLSDDKAPSWIDAVIEGRKSSQSAVQEVSRGYQEGPIGDVKKAISAAISRFDCTIQLLIERNTKCTA